MRKLDHENINKFIGLSIDGAQYAVDLIAKGSLLFDPFFMLCIMRDVAEGLKYLHNSFIGVHGSLSSQCCLVNDSWQVKLADYGTGSLREDDRVKKKRLLWMAPEHLRSLETSSTTSKEGDIYSFAIIASEVVTRKAAWNLNERKERVDGEKMRTQMNFDARPKIAPSFYFLELVYMLKKGGPTPLRPILDIDGEINAAVVGVLLYYRQS
ncbi:hypothetical protein COOONC_03394 [Cooperia oncophora]